MRTLLFLLCLGLLGCASTPRRALDYSSLESSGKDWAAAYEALKIQGTGPEGYQIQGQDLPDAWALKHMKKLGSQEGLVLGRQARTAVKLKGIAGWAPVALPGIGGLVGGLVVVVGSFLANQWARGEHVLAGAGVGAGLGLATGLGLAIHYSWTAGPEIQAKRERAAQAFNQELHLRLKPSSALELP